MFTLSNLEEAFRHLNVDLDNTHFLIAYSGGLDSTVLVDSMLHLAQTCEFGLTLGHVNHHLRSDSDRDEAFCREMAREANIPFYCMALNPDERERESIESWARQERYMALERLRVEVGARWTLTAHHADDQIETVLMKLLQRASLLGLAGIRPRRGSILRPLLDFPRSALYNWAKSRNLRWIEDPTNTDMHFLRNQMRHGAIGRLYTTEQNHRRSLLGLAKIGQEYESHCASASESIAAKATAGSIPGTVVLPKEVVVTTVEEDIFKLTIKRLVQDHLGITVNLSTQHWQNFRHFVLKSVVGKIFDLSNGIQVLMDRSGLILYHQSQATPPEPVELELGRTKWGFHEFQVKQRADEPAPRLGLRSWKQGDRIQLAAGANSKLVSDMYIDSKFNRLEKAHWPLITTPEDKVVWIPGLRQPENTLRRGPWEIKWQTEIRRR